MTITKIQLYLLSTQAIALKLKRPLRAIEGGKSALLGPEGVSKQLGFCIQTERSNITFIAGFGFLIVLKMTFPTYDQLWKNSWQELVKDISATLFSIEVLSISKQFENWQQHTASKNSASIVCFH